MRLPREGTRGYFDRIPGKWHTRYSQERPVVHRLNRVLRRAIYERYELTFEHSGPIEGATVLDIGCGTGEYSLEFARKGASRVVGVDFAPGMVAASDTAARKAGLAQSCKFVCADFMDLKLEERFEIVVAVGLFDYVGRPGVFLRKIAKVTAGVFLASFPSNRGLWKLQRAIRYNRIKGCEIHDYRAEQLLSLYQQAQFASVRIHPMKRGLFVVARKGENL